MRMYPDGRLADWTGGRLGRREWERHGTLAAAEVRAEELRERLRRQRTWRAPRSDATLDLLMRDAIAHLRAVGAPEGTIRQ